MEAMLIGFWINVQSPGIKLGGRSAPEIALSIIAQLVSEAYNK